MYEERLGTDWTELSEAEAIDRAFALGVASAFDYENDDEFERLRGALDSTYDRSIIDLAYQEGKQKARRLRGEVPDGGTVWDRLVGSDGVNPRGESAGAPDPPRGHPGPSGRLPESLDRAGFLEGGEELGALGLPPLLGGRPNGEQDRDGDGDDRE